MSFIGTPCRRAVAATPGLGSRARWTRRRWPVSVSKMGPGTWSISWPGRFELTPVRRTAGTIVPAWTRYGPTEGRRALDPCAAGRGADGRLAAAARAPAGMIDPAVPGAVRCRSPIAPTRRAPPSRRGAGARDAGLEIGVTQHLGGCWRRRPGSAGAGLVGGVLPGAGRALDQRSGTLSTTARRPSKGARRESCCRPARVASSWPAARQVRRWPR